MKKYEIYLDLDGVCIDFLTSAFEIQGYDPEMIFAKWKATQPGELFPTLSIEKNPLEFFTDEALGEEKFWRELKAYKWFSLLYTELSSFGNVMFLSAPSGAPGCLSGKHHWLTDYFGANFSEYIFTKHKDRLAHERAILIDDMPFNVSAFKARGGRAFLFPRIWNKLHSICEPTGYVLSNVERVLKG
tara:strand:- start:625 stop:1185 length:561 start_codon:yes stop_codon:yes gene_type:complete